MKARYYYKDGTITSSYTDTEVLHRIDDPAIEYSDGEKDWWVDSKLHRVDGPAIVYASGNKEWYVDGKQYSEKEFSILIKEAKALPLALRLIDPREWVRKMI